MNEFGDQADEVPVAGLGRGDEDDVGERLCAGCRRPARDRSASPKSSATWQPMIGWMPFSTIFSANSSAPKRLPVSAMPSAGMPVGGGKLGELLDRQRPFEQRIGRVHAQVNEPDLAGDPTHGAILLAPTVGEDPARVHRSTSLAPTNRFRREAASFPTGPRARRRRRSWKRARRNREPVRSWCPPELGRGVCSRFVLEVKSARDG